MAQERIDFLFAAQVEGEQQMKKLIDSVDALRAEVNKLKDAYKGLTGESLPLERAIGRNGKVLDENSKALRNARQGTQQLGMQFNDFATSVSTGASVTQAFSQQLGQVGYAMSMMGGKVGAVGSFLAGPWGAAILVATMVLGPMIEGLIDMGESAKEAADKTRELSDAHDQAVDAALNYEMANNRLKESIYGTFDATQANITAEMAAINVKRQAALETYNQAKQNWALAKSQAAVNSQFIGIGRGMGGTVGAGATAIGQIAEWWQGNAATMEEQSKIMAENVAKISKLEGQTIGKLAEALAPEAQKRNRSGGSKTPKISDAEKEAKRMREAYAKEEQKAVTDFLSFVSKLDQADMSQYQKDVAELQQKFGKMPLAEQADKAREFNDALASFDIKQINKDYQEFQKTLDDGLLPAIAQVASKPTEAMTAISTSVDQLESSFESIGNAISDAFQGMLTGAMSFKEGMRNIIGSVISELWRLYVVQQIVGFVTNALSGIGLPLPQARAVGGSVNSNQPYMVGEKGPELFVPRGNGTIIPNHNMKGGAGAGGINITVDARGSSDPAAVRAQVQQGILEAAPAIIAAAEARTNRGLRRPRLAGVMQ